MGGKTTHIYRTVEVRYTDGTALGLILIMVMEGNVSGTQVEIHLIFLR